MKRMHVHVAVADIPHAVEFYAAMFAARPVVVKPDYAKWMLEDPRVNFAVSSRGLNSGVDHLGLQVDSDEELAELRASVGEAHIGALEQPDAACCYATSDKYWVTDPQGIAWETFHTLGDIPVYGEHVDRQGGSVCCAPKAAAVTFVKRGATKREG